MEHTSDVILTFKDQQYPLDKVKAKAMSGPIIEAKLEELNISEDALALVTLSADSVELHAGPIIFFKHEGKYLVFGGMANVTKAVTQGKSIKGHLLSSPALKSVRIVKHEPAQPAQVAALANHFSSSSRYDGDRTRGSYGDKPSYPRKTSGQPLHARSSGTRSGS